jgi:prepilin-type N-terminal cleavage/methylation domain-containing protein
MFKLNNSTKAFTLIELLVVIAIIAILAAILFPVFAQAKVAAKKAVTVSNNKQISLGAIMYMNDFDDHFMIAAYNNSYNANPANPDSVPLLMAYPYIKNMGVMIDPMDPATIAQREYPDSSVINPASVSYTAQQAFLIFCATADWGINYQYFDPTFIDANGNLVQNSVTQSQIARPADTYMATSSLWGRTSGGTPYGGGNAGVDAPCIFLPDGTDTRPNAMPYGSYWYGGWNPDQPLAWNEFGGVWPWWNGTNVVLSYGDGHAKTAQISSLTTGCNVLDGWGGAITNESTYHWSSTF